MCYYARGRGTAVLSLSERSRPGLVSNLQPAGHFKACEGEPETAAGVSQLHVEDGLGIIHVMTER